MGRSNIMPVVVSIAVVFCIMGTGYLSLCSYMALQENQEIEVKPKNPSRQLAITSNKRSAGDKGIYFVTGTIASYGYGNGQHSRFFIMNTFDWLWPTHADSGPILIIWDHQGWSDGWRREMNTRGIQFTQKSAGAVNVNDFDPNVFRMIIISEYQPNQHMNKMESMVSTMEDYVNNGGILIDMFGTNYQRRWSRGVPGPFGVRTNGNGNSHNFVVAVNHPMVRNMNRPSFSGSSASHGEITTIPQGSDILLTVGQNQGGMPVACWLEVDLTAYADNAAILGHGDENKICYARHRPYTLSVNITSAKELTEVSEVKVFLDYNTTNATLCYNWTQKRFYKYQDTDGHVQFLVDDSTVTTDSVERWWLNFSVIFNFTFPHEDQVDCFISTAAITGIVRTDRFPNLFKVENDMELVGIPDLTGEFQGALEKNDWIRGNENINVANLMVRYAGAVDIYPKDDYFDVKITDKTGQAWWDNESSNESVEINLTSRNVSDLEEEYYITIENIPGTGICMTNLTFPVRIDADPPLYPVNLKCHADDFKDKETEHTNQPGMFVTWDAVEDPASGLKGYYYSQADNSGSINGTFLNVTEVELKNLHEGFASIYVWCIDMVGNIGESASSGILVDLSPPVFSNHTPMDGSWHNQTDIDCSIEIFDGAGSGVDGSSIEYAVSDNGVHGFDYWIPAWIPENNEPMVPSTKYIFHEGEDNYIKWRSKDITGNGFVESSSVNLKVDTTPINFAAEISPQMEWYDYAEISTTILVSDIGSGVKPDSIETRISVSGPNDFGRWMSIDAENISENDGGSHELTVTFRYAEGKDNFIMFRGTDLVGNPITLSDKFNLKIDTSPVYFGIFTPLENDYADDKMVECFIQIFDDGSGVNPSSVEYSIANGGDNENFGPWNKGVNVVEGNPTQVLMELEFDWGAANFIRWRADDMMGTGHNISIPYRVWVNSKPEAIITSPAQGSYFSYDDEIAFDASGSSDEDGDNLSFYWSSNVSLNRSVGRDAKFIVRLAPGKHTISLFVSDGHGYNESEKVKIEVISRVEYEKDSDEDGFSDGLERESGTDPHNGAVIPEGEPDIVITEPGGILSGGSSLLFIILACIFLLVLVILIIFIILRKKKKSEKKVPAPSAPGPTQQTYPGPSPHPYQQGQYQTPVSQGYSGPDPGHRAGFGMQGIQSPQLMLPPGPHVVPGGPAFQAFPSQQGPPGIGPGIPADPGYLLPSFQTDQGLQDLQRMALPPGPASPPAPVAADLGIAYPPSVPDMPLQPPILPDAGSPGTPLPTPPDPISSTRVDSTFPAEPLPSPPPDTVAETAASPAMETTGPSSDNIGDLAELDAYLAALGGMTESPGSEPPKPPVPMETPAQAASEITMNRQQTGLLASSSETQESASPSLPPPNSGGNRSGFQQIQCHSCSNNYTAEIVQLPALVTCPVCQTQGMIESM